MNEVQEKGNYFVGYEYRKVTVPGDMESLWRDSLSHFGWTLDKSEPATVKHVWGPIRVMLAPLALIPGSPAGKMIRDRPSDSKVDLTFKRDKAITNKAELNPLQSRFEASAGKIRRLEDSKTIGATIVSYIIGLLGTVFMGFSVFSYLDGLLSLSIVLAVPGFIGWILPFIIYQVVKGGRTRKIAPLIQKENDAIYEVCAKANAILHS